MANFDREKRNGKEKVNPLVCERERGGGICEGGKESGF